jgi:hypothetical protein
MFAAHPISEMCSYHIGRTRRVRLPMWKRERPFLGDIVYCSFTSPLLHLHRSLAATTVSAPPNRFLLLISLSLLSLLPPWITVFGMVQLSWLARKATDAVPGWSVSSSTIRSLGGRLDRRPGAQVRQFHWRADCQPGLRSHSPWHPLGDWGQEPLYCSVGSAAKPTSFVARTHNAWVTAMITMQNSHPHVPGEIHAPSVCTFMIVHKNQLGK